VVPYRVPSSQAEPPDEGGQAREERGLVVAMGLFVAVSLVRVAFACAAGETFGAEESLAFLVVLAGLACLACAASRALSRAMKEAVRRRKAR
jgi:hypothetical protein